jgi:hypothetical protein
MYLFIHPHQPFTHPPIHPWNFLQKFCAQFLFPPFELFIQTVVIFWIKSALRTGDPHERTGRHITDRTFHSGMNKNYFFLNFQLVHCV